MYTSKFAFVIVLVALLMGCSGSSASEQALEDLEKYPAFNEVVNELLDNYSVDEENGYFRLAKKPEGWYVGVYSPVEYYKPTTEVLFWSLEEEKYLTLEDKLINKHATAADKKDRFIRENYNFEFYADRSPYYGYNTDYEDNIALLEGKENLSDDHLHALGCAYFKKAYAYIGRGMNWYGGDTDLARPVPDDSLQKFMEYAELNVSTFDLLADQNPSYEGFVGRVRTKQGNDIMGYWMEMIMKGNKTEAEKFLPRIHYPASILDMARNMLRSCEPNAILFTHGDNDTYPLWYVQAFEGFRKDVAIVNLSLLNVAWYAEQFKKMYDLPLDLPLDLVGSPAASLVFAANETTPSQTLESFFQGYLDNLKKKQKVEVAGSDDYYYSSPVLTLADSAGMNRLSLPSSGYLYYSDLVVLNIVYNNKWKRPVYFAAAGLPTDELKNFVINEGYVSRLTSAEQPPYSVDHEKIYHSLTKVFEYSELIPGIEENRILNNLLYIYYSAANGYYGADDYKKAEEIIDLGTKQVSAEYGCTIYSGMATLLLNLDRPEKAKKLCNEMMPYLEEEEMDSYDIQRYQSLAEMLAMNGLSMESTKLMNIVDKKKKELDN